MTESTVQQAVARIREKIRHQRSTIDGPDQSLPLAVVERADLDIVLEAAEQWREDDGGITVA